MRIERWINEEIPEAVVALGYSQSLDQSSPDTQTPPTMFWYSVV